MPPGMNQAPLPAPHEVGLSGVLTGNLQEGYQMQTSEGIWPLITLEPAIHRWLSEEDHSGQTLNLRGIKTPGVPGCGSPGFWIKPTEAEAHRVPGQHDPP